METPTDRHLASLTPTQIIHDGEGRAIALRRLNALDKLRLFKAAGPALSQNHLWLGMATLACSVSGIDEVPIPVPTTEAQIEALVSRLGDAGINAIAQALAPDASEDASVDAVHYAGN